MVLDRIQALLNELQELLAIQNEIEIEAHNEKLNRAPLYGIYKQGTLTRNEVRELSVEL